jgi:hypothetical protein
MQIIRKHFIRLASKRGGKYVGFFYNRRSSQKIMKKLFLILTLAIGILSVPQVQAEFSDLPKTDHHYFPLSYLEFESVIQGYDDGTVRPGNLINRAELVKILVEGQGLLTNSSHKNCFPDVKEEWYASYVCFAKEKGWVEGYPNGTFQAGNNVNKVEALKIILNAFGVETIRASRARIFSDTSVDDWFAPFLATAIQKVLIEEIGGSRFDPSNPRSRGEIAEMVARIKMIQVIGDDKYTDLLRAEFENYLYLHELRRNEGVTEKLKVNPVLWKVARGHAKDMGDNIRELSHGSSDGVTQSFDRIKNAIKAEDDPNFPGRTGENIGGGSVRANPYDTVTYVHDKIFMPEDPTFCNHRTTLLSQCLPFTEVGVGIYRAAGGEIYFVNDFITRVYADTMGMRVGLELPSEYSNTALYKKVNEEETYITTIAQNCNATRIRAQYFVYVGVFMENGNCKIYEHAWSRQPEWSVLRGYLETQVFSIENTSTYYTAEKPSQNDVWIAVDPDGAVGWQIVGHSNQNLPAYYDFGETANISFTNSKTGESLQFRLKFLEGWTEITQL